MTVAGTIPCPRCRSALIPLDGRLVCHGCERDLGRIVPGEEDLGFQRTCESCESDWPITGEFWFIKRYERGEAARSGGRDYVREESGASLVCLATHRERNRASYEARVAGRAIPESEARAMDGNR